MQSLFLALLITVPSFAQTWVTETQCISNCNIPTSSGNQRYSSEGGPYIAWGRMSSHATERVKECGSNPLCMLMRAAVGYPIALFFDAPYYAVKGVGYGLYYGAIGIGKAGKAVGRGIAYPFRDRPQSPPTSWEAYKRQILKSQKRLAKRDKSQRSNYKWCKGHVPLSHGPSRLEWESRCNPGDMVSRDYLPESVRYTNSGETMPMGLPKDGTTATAAAEAPAHTAEAIRQEALVKAGLMAPPAPAAGAPSTPAASPPAPSPSAQASGSAPTSGASEPAFTPPVSATPLPADGQILPAPAPPPGTPPATAAGSPTPGLPPSATPDLKDPATVLKSTDENVKEAGSGGFETKAPMLGKKQEVLNAFQTAADSTLRNPPDYQTAIAAQSRAAPKLPMGPGHGNAGPGQSAPVELPAGVPMPKRAPLPKIRPHALVSQGKARVLGDPDRFRYVFHRQTGNTCVEMVARQLLFEEGVVRSEDELFFRALEKGWFIVPQLCQGKTLKSTDRCNVRYDPTTKTCSIHTVGGKVGQLADYATCKVARALGVTDYARIPEMFLDVSGKPFVSKLVRPTGSTQQALAIKLAEASAAHAEIVKVLSAGKAVGVTLGTAAWQGTSQSDLHAVVITAAVLDLTGQPLGYYVNDSNDGSYGRYVPAATIEKAWVEDDVHRIYRQ